MQALEAAHKIGVAHGNLTEESIMLMRDGNIKVGGWEFALTGKNLFKPDTDIWNASCLLYMMLSDTL